MAKFKVITSADSQKKEEPPVEMWLDQTGDSVILMYRIKGDVGRSLGFIDGERKTACLFSGDCAILGLTKI